MIPKENKEEPTNSQVQKENEDLPNIPASTEKINSGKTVHREIKETSKLHDEGKTDNTEKNSKN